MINNIASVNTSNKVLTAYKSQVETNYAKTNHTAGVDKAHISREGQEFKAVLDAVTNTPDIREDRVSELTNRIKSGEYSISSKDIAFKMLNEGWL